MKNINIKLFISSCFFLFLLVGCDLTSLNENPNEPTSDVDYNLNDAQLAATLRPGIPMEGDDEQRIKSLMLDYYTQMLIDGNVETVWDTEFYLMNEDWNQRMYRRVQTNVSALNRIISSLSERGDLFSNSIAVAKIWRVFNQASGIDYFGPIPFGSYKEIQDNPPYISVQEAYNEFFRELEEAVALLDQNGTNSIFIDSASDIIFKNDTQKWRRFANSLRLRFAMRLTEVDAAKSKEEATKAIAAGVMESAEDNAYLPPKANGDWGQNYNYTMFQVNWSTALNMSKSVEKLLTGIGGINFPTNVVNQRAGLNGAPTPLSSVHPEKVDPRGPIMYEPGFRSGDWKGMPLGVPKSQQKNGEWDGPDYAELGILIRNGATYFSRPYDVMLYEEVCFLKSEAAWRGYGGDAKAEYEKGVRASFATWGVASTVDEYLTSTAKNLAGTSANFDDQAGDGNTIPEKIITQKYLALFPDMAMEAWNDRRRLNLPRMDVGLERNALFYNASNLNPKDPSNFIKRVQYPQNEAQNNKTEYDKGVQLLGGPDNVTTPIWWDKNANYCTSAD